MTLDHERIPLFGRAGESSLSLRPPTTADDGSGYVRLPLYLEASGLSAQATIELEGWGGGGAGPIAFFEDLATAWKGWQGSKEWHDDGATVVLSATHDGIGTIALDVSVTPDTGWDGPGSWTLRVVVPVDPGSLDAGVDMLRAMLKTDG